MFQKIRQNMEMRRWVARDPRAHDIYIVEFPKSGITWLCTLIANMALQEAGSQEQVTHYNVQQYIPDIHMANDMPIGDSLLSAIPQRLIKSHVAYNRYYQAVIYLARHPAAVMRSYCTYLNQQAGNEITLEQLLEHKKLGLPAWQAHVRSWLETNSRAGRLHLVRYEDLVDDTAGTLRTLCRNLGWAISDRAIEQAGRLSEADRMKTMENVYRDNNPGYTMTFVKKRAPDMSDDMLRHIEALCADELVLLGYSK